jgi:beta-lactamase class D
VRAWILLFLVVAFALPAAAQVRTICTVVGDRNGAILFAEGDCDTRVTPASTFKVPLAVIGFEAGFLVDERTPTLPFRQGYADWGGAAWTRANDPSGWMVNSVLWYSRAITTELGAATMQRFVRDLRYGNADFSGDPGADNALDRAWISSSLKISPAEQVGFLARLMRRDPPVSRRAQDMAVRLLETHALAGGWTATGKTGSAYPRNADGTFNRSRGWGWYVGWMTRGEQAFPFAHLRQDETRQSGPGGLRARAAWLEAWPAVSARIGAD